MSHTPDNAVSQSPVSEIVSLRAQVAELEQIVAQQATTEALLRQRLAAYGADDGASGASHRVQEAFLANMSHELRTPLNAILGLSEALQEYVYGSLNQRQQQVLRTVEENGRQLLALVNDMLDLANLEAGRVHLQVDQVALEPLCQTCVREVTEQAQQKQIALSLHMEESLPPITADPRRLRQILLHLLQNAIKFTPEGGKIGLDVRLDGEIAEMSGVAFTIWDTGIGVAKEQQEQIFASFVQGDEGLSRHYGGAGIGLALVARLVELHGGRVALASEVARGSRFTVVLPAHGREHAAA
jgi:signal transduction histidine kinase